MTPADSSASGDRPERLRRLALVSFVGIAAALLLVAALALAALQIEEAIRSYVKGESLWSKGQKDAVIALETYARTGDPAAWTRYTEALLVPLGDRRARLALQADPPDVERARRGFLQGGLQEEELDGMIRLFRWFGDWQPVAQSIEHWTRGDSLIAELRDEAGRIRSERRAASPDSTRLADALARVERLNGELARQERQFTAAIDRAGNRARRLSQWAIGGLTLLLLVTAGGLTWHVFRLLRDREASLRRSERRYRHLFENNVAGVFRAAEDGRMLECNPAFARTFRYDAPSDLEGTDVRKLYARGEGRGRYLRRLREEGRLVNEEFRLERQDGSPVWVLENSILTDDPGTGRRIVEGTLIDITDRKEAERERQLLSTAVETMRTGVLITGPELEPPGPRIQYVNEAMTEITGYSEAELLGATPRLLQGPETDPAVLERLKARLRAGEPFEGQTVNYREDGTPYHLRWQVTPLRDEGGEVEHFVSVQEDVTAQVRAERRLAEREERFRQMAESIEDVFWLRDPEMNEILYVSPAYEEIWGRPKEELAERPGSWLESVHPEDRERVERTVFGETPLVFEAEYRIVRPDGEVRWIQDKGFPVEGEDGGGESRGEGEGDRDPARDHPRRVAGVARDVTERKRLEEQLRHRALHDPLTDLANRTLLKDRVEQGLARARRHEKPLGLLMLDVDHFKRINDRLGHAAGDRVLTELARRLEGVTRDGDTVARWGGDEFVILLPEVEGTAGVHTLRARIREALRTPVQASGEPLQVDVTMGAVIHDERAGNRTVRTGDPEELVRYGDVALHRAKETAGGDFHLFTGEESVEGAAQIRLEQKLRTGIEEGQFVPHYQPIVRLAEGTLAGVEVLARWRHPERGLLPPAEFLSLAEELGLLRRLGDRVARSAMEASARWPAPGDDGWYLSINTSARQFDDPDLAETLGRWIRESGLPADRLVLEVTERSVMRASSRIEELQSLGVRIHIDDFGTEYSTFTYLRDLEVDGIKIDRTFIAEIADRPKDAALAESLVTLGRRLEIDVTAEGIETDEQRRILAEMGCPLGQGYLFGRPVPGEELRARLEEMVV